MEPDKNKSSTNSMFGNTAGGFGGFSFSQSSTTPQSSPAKPSLFGSTAPTAFGGGNLFGSTNNTKAGATTQNTPAGNTATPSTPKTSLFGGTTTNNPASGTTAPNSFNVFGNPNTGNANPTGSAPSINLNANQPNQAPQAGSLFGSKPQASNNSLFGNLANTNSSTGSPASNPTVTATNTPKFSFGGSSPNPPPAKDAAASQSSLFGGGAANQDASTKNGASNNTNIFAPKQPDTSNLNIAPGTAGTTTTMSTATSSASPFSPSIPSKPTGSLFGAATSTGNTGAFSMKSTAPAKSSPLALNSTTNSGGGGQSNAQNSSASDASKATAGAPPATPSNSNAAPNNTITNNNTTSNNSSNKPNINLAPSLLKGKTLEDLVSRWNSELDERVEDFKLTANEIAAWDQVLIQNGDQISALYEELQRIDPIQSSIDQTLDYVETQQSELSAALDDYDRQLTSQQAGGVVDMKMMTGGNNRIRTAGQEREEAYKTAEEVHAQLNDMAGSLSTMIAELNSLAGPANRIDESSLADGNNFVSSSNSNMEDPIVQISGILNAHLGSLNWISEITNELSSKILELESRISNTKLEFGLESNNPNKQSSDIDDFNNLSLANSYNNHGANGGGIQGFGGMRHLSGGVLSHPRR